MEAITETMSQEQPYEKFMRFGAEALTEAELLAVILRAPETVLHWSWQKRYFRLPGEGKRD